MNSWKHDTWWFAVSFCFVCGISFGGYLCSLWYEEEEFIYPSPVVYFEGKRSEPGEKLAPGTLRALELGPVREGRDPFERVR